MFASQTKSLTFQPKDGDKIIVSGYVSVYEPYGSYQVYITKMQLDGIGDLYLAYEELKQKLSQEGLFDEAHKLKLPRIPKAIGVITSKTGAAVRDIINVVKTRFPLTKLIVYPASVQGVFAKNEIVQQIEKANRDQICDCLIVGRGGGSIEDLWPFNEEIVARAIYASKIPIISAVGHETDYTIADFVADKRASTPSHAAELAVPHHTKVEEYINQQVKTMGRLLHHQVTRLTQQLNYIVNRPVMKQPMRLIQEDLLRFNHIYDQLLQKNPKITIQQKQQDIRHHMMRLQTLYSHQLERKRHAFTRLAESLELVNPLSIMTKGYAMVKQDDKILKSMKEVNPNKPLNVSMHDGEIACEIIDMKGKQNG